MRVASMGALLFAVMKLYCQTAAQDIDTVQSAIESGNQPEAWRLAGEALARHPKDGGLLNLRGVLQAQKKEFVGARADFEAATILAPGLTPAWRNLGRACLALHVSDARCATEAWEHVLRAQPEDTEALATLAGLYQYATRFTDSLAAIDKLPAQEAARPPMLALRCGDLTGLHRTAEARDAAQKLIATGYTEDDVSDIYPTLNSFGGSNLLLELVAHARGEAGAPVLDQLAEAYKKLNRLPDLRQTLEKLAALQPEEPAHLLELARVAYRMHDLEGAIGYLGHARDLRPNDANIHFRFGIVAMEMDLPVEARRSLDKALALEPANPEYNYAIGGLLLGAGQARESIAYFQKYVDKHGSDARGHFALGAAYCETMDFDRCRAEMESINKNPQTEAGAAYFLGRAARMEEKYDEAARQLERASQLAPNFGEAQTELARVRIEQGQLTQARAAVDRALELDPDNFQANSTLLNILEVTHDPSAPQQAEHLRTVDAGRSRRRELLMRTIEVKPY